MTFTQFCHQDAFLSKFTINNINYNCVEHYFTAGKPRIFCHFPTLEQIMKSTNPSKMKFLGRNIENFNKSLWEESGDILIKLPYLITTLSLSSELLTVQ